jgi:hypothetical protein
MSDELKVSVDDDKLDTGTVLELMELQEALSGDKPAAAMRRMIEVIQPAVVSIVYNGEPVESLLKVPFKHLQKALAQVMAVLGNTDPN